MLTGMMKAISAIVFVVAAIVTVLGLIVVTLSAAWWTETLPVATFQFILPQALSLMVLAVIAYQLCLLNEARMEEADWRDAVAMAGAAPERAPASPAVEAPAPEQS
jgi:hypothetical protein